MKLYWRYKKEADTSPGIFYWTWIPAQAKRVGHGVWLVTDPAWAGEEE